MLAARSYPEEQQDIVCMFTNIYPKEIQMDKYKYNIYSIINLCVLHSVTICFVVILNVT